MAAAGALRRSFVLMLALALSLSLSSLYVAESLSGVVPNLCHLPLLARPRDNCNIQCLIYDPVCGVNGVTYGCGCPEANCYAVRVVKLGAC
ncbi:unnamed protein product [Spirodela intermedia]|uniref:Uncharacterized protein n=1 Tax=Spirodela intermedia TaxID=51605 RepID=A0A7I8KVL4_SPIIN|nr:unnamed protein product [Spirodela intermedia]